MANALKMKDVWFILLWAMFELCILSTYCVTMTCLI